MEKRSIVRMKNYVIVIKITLSVNQTVVLLLVRISDMGNWWAYPKFDFSRGTVRRTIYSNSVLVFTPELWLLGTCNTEKPLVSEQVIGLTIWHIIIIVNLFVSFYHLFLARIKRNQVLKQTKIWRVVLPG